VGAEKKLQRHRVVVPAIARHSCLTIYHCIKANDSRYGLSLWSLSLCSGCASVVFMVTKASVQLLTPSANLCSQTSETEYTTDFIAQHRPRASDVHCDYAE